MIVRILGEGQLQVDDAHLTELNVLDDALIDAVDAGDEQHFALALGRLLDRVRAGGTPVPADSLVGSDVVRPAADLTVAEVRALLGDEGLIPG